MPFQSWETRPLALNNCILTVIAATVDVAVEIKVNLNIFPAGLLDTGLHPVFLLATG